MDRPSYAYWRRTTANATTAVDDEENRTPFGNGRWTRKRVNTSHNFIHEERVGERYQLEYSLTSPSQHRVGLKPHDFGDTKSDTHNLHMVNIEGEKKKKERETKRVGKAVMGEFETLYIFVKEGGEGNKNIIVCLTLIHDIERPFIH